MKARITYLGQRYTVDHEPGWRRVTRRLQRRHLLLLATVAVLLVLIFGVLFPRHPAAAAGYVHGGWDCVQGKRILRLSAFGPHHFSEGLGGNLSREGIKYEYSLCLNSSPCAVYNYSYTSVTRAVLNREYGYDLLETLESLGPGRVVVRIHH